MTILYVMIHFIVERSMGMREPRAPDSGFQRAMVSKDFLEETWPG